jgi:glycosyltransferase involved in cell wall biosynthesis
MVTVAASEVTVVIPAHPARLTNGLLTRAIASVAAQTHPPAALSLAIDLHAEGAAVTRQRALDAVQTDWVAFLDSDDEWLPHHLQALTQVADTTPRCIWVHSYFEPTGMSDPLGHFGRPFNPATPHHTTMTVLCRTDIAREAGFRGAPAGSNFCNEDWEFITAVCRIAVEGGWVMMPLAERTWRYHGHGGNTSGMPHKGDAGR